MTLLKYPSDLITGCDVDEDAVAFWNEEWPRADVQVSAADEVTDWGDGPPIGFADIDPYGAPYLAVDNLLRNAPLAEKVAIVLTDGSNSTRIRAKKPFDFENLKWGRMASIRSKAQKVNLLTEIVKWVGSYPGVTVIHSTQTRPFGSPTFIPVYAWLLIRTS